VGHALGALGIEIPFTTLGAVIAGLAVGLPLYVIASRTALRGSQYFGTWPLPVSDGPVIFGWPRRRGTSFRARAARCPTR
jgi:hypothetical protein